MIIVGRPLKGLFKRYPLAARDFVIWFKKANVKSKYSKFITVPIVSLPAHFACGMVLEWMHERDIQHSVAVNDDGSYKVTVYKRRPAGPPWKMKRTPRVCGVKRLPLVIMRLGFDQVERVLRAEAVAIPKVPTGIAIGLDVEMAIFAAAKNLELRKNGEEQPIIP